MRCQKRQKSLPQSSFLATGDEMFGGYDRYRMAFAASLYQILPTVYN